MTERSARYTAHSADSEAASPRKAVRSRIAQGDVVEPAAVRGRESEAAFQRRVIEYAEARGWVIFHDYDPRLNAAGFPDLLCVRERVLWIECKSDIGALSRDQEAFLARLRAAAQEVFVFRPRDWERVLEVLV